MKITAKPWGREVIWAKTDKYAAKILEIKKNCSMSLQYHNTKEETLYVESGHILVWINKDKNNGKTLQLKAGEVIHIKPKILHRFTAIIDSKVYEVSTPELDDMVRLLDDYGR